MKISIVIPAYNEENRISHTLDRVLLYLKIHPEVIEVFVVLNNCTDNTKNVVSAYVLRESKIKIIDCGTVPHTGGGTKGYAVRRGFMEAKGDYVLFMDADNATDIFEIDKLIPFVKQGIEVVIGSRYVRDSLTPVKQSLLRIILSRIGNILVQVLVLPGIKDTQCGFKLCSRKAIATILPYLKIDGWGFDMELLAYARQFNFKIKEVGIVWADKSHGSIKPASFLYTLRELVKIYFRIKKI